MINKSCPIKTSKEWNLLVEQMGNEDAAWGVWKYHGYDYPKQLKTTAEIVKELGIRKNMSSLQVAKMAIRLKRYNELNGTSHSFKENKVGQADLYNPTLNISYYPVKVTLKIINDENALSIINKEYVKTFINNNSDIFIQDGNQYFKDGELYPTYEDAFNINEMPDYIIGETKSLKPKFQELADRYIEKVSLYKKSIRNLKTLEKNAKSVDDKLSYRKRIQSLERSVNEIIGTPGDIDNPGIINNILKLNALEDVVTYANDQLNEVEELIKKDSISSEELDYIRQVVSLWIKAGDFSEEESLFWTKDELERVDRNEILQKVKLQFNEFRNRAEDINTRYLIPKDEEIVRNAAIDEFNLSDDFSIDKNMKDVNWATMQMLDISEINDPVLQLMSSTLKTATFLAHQESILIEDEVNQLLNKIKTIDWNLFKQTFSNEDSRETGNLVFRFSQKYWETTYELFERARKATNKEYKSRAYKEAIDYLKYNSLIFDVRKLFPNEELWGISFTQDEINSHIQELKDNLGEFGYEEYYDKAKNLLDRYLLAREAQRVLFEGEYETDAEVEAAMQIWEVNNSPATEADIIASGSPTIKVADTYVHPTGKFSVKVPKKYIDGKETGFYDKKFEKIEANEDLRNLYNYVYKTLNDLKQYLPDEKTDWMQVNSLPTMYNTILEEYSKDKLHAGFSPLMDKLKEFTRTNDLNTVDNSIRNPLTGEIDKKLQTSLLVDYNAQIKDLLNIKIIGYTQEHGEEPSIGTIIEFKKDIANELSKLKSFDLGKLIKAYSLMGLTYKHKASVQDIMEASDRLIKRRVEQVENSAGKPLFKFGNNLTTKGLTNVNKMLDTFMDTYYGYKMDKPFGEGSKKIYTDRENKLKSRLEEIIKINKEKLANNEIPEDEYERIDSIATNQLELLGGVRVWSKFGDLVLQYTQLKGMGWNVFAGVTNMLYGFISNIVEASDGRNYTPQEFWKALALTLNTTGGINKLSPEAKKIRNIIRHLDSLKISRYELYNASTPSTLGKLAKNLKGLNPYNPQTSTEYINQSTVVVAMLLHQKVKLNGEEINMYDAYDSDGKLKEGIEFIDNTDETKIKIKIDKVIKMNHGNYDPDSPLNVKRTLLGRALSQFRTWAYQGFAERFMGETEDYQLGITRKGRYISVLSYYKTQKENNKGFISSTFFITKQLLRKLTFGKYSTQFNEVQGLSEVDAANMRKNMTELVMYSILTIISLLLKNMFDDSDKSTAKYASYFWINQLTRLNTDMMFYVSPTQFERLTRNAMPAFTTVIDLEKALRYSWNLIEDPDSDILQSGINRGDSKAARAWRRVIPNPLNAITRLESTTQQLTMNKPVN